MIDYVSIHKATFADIPNKFEAGTPNIVGAISLSSAIDFINDILINIQAGGTSSKSTFTRLKEVISIYYKNYSFLFFFPFFARYLIKIIIKLSKL